MTPTHVDDVRLENIQMAHDECDWCAANDDAPCNVGYLLRTVNTLTAETRVLTGDRAVLRRVVAALPDPLAVARLRRARAAT